MSDRCTAKSDTRNAKRPFESRALLVNARNPLELGVFIGIGFELASATSQFAEPGALTS